MIRAALAALIALAWVQQPPAPREGIVIRELGVGFHSNCELPNLPLRQGEPRRPPYVGRLDTWMPFQITLENLGPAVEGSLVIRDAFATGAPDIVFRKQVSLPAQGRKHVRFPIFHRGGQANRVLTFESDSGGTILLEGARSVEISPPHTAGATSSMLLVATESRGNFSHFLGRSRGGPLTQNRYVLPVLPTELPSTALEYHGIDALALDDIPVDTLSSDQQDAIRQFVSRGGTLVLCSFRHAERMRQTKLADLLPGRTVEIRNVANVGALQAATGFPCVLDAPLAMTTYGLESGARGWDPAAQVLAHRRFDAGVVVACGFPLSAPFLERWPGAPRFAEVLLEGRAATPVPIAGGIQTTNLRHDIAFALKESMVRSIPPFRTVLWIMIAYAAITAIVPYALFRRLNRLEWSWAAIFAFALAGAGVVYGVGQSYLRQGSVAFRVGVIDGGAEDGSHLRHNFWSLFTARGDRLNLSFEEPSAVPYPLGRELKLRGASDNSTITIGYDDVRLGEFRTYSQDSSLFETTDRASLPARLIPTATEAEGTTTVRLRTSGGFPIRRAWIVGADDVSEISDFPGQETAVRVPNSTMAEIAARLKAGNDLLFEKVVAVLLAQAQARSKLARKRVLLYQYDGAPSLKNQAIPERGLDFGLLDIDGVEVIPSQERWNIRRQESPEQNLSAEAALYSAEGVVYSMVLRDLADGCCVRDIRFSDPGYVVLEIFDHRDQSWHTVRGNSSFSAEGVVHQSPLGSAYAQLRTRARNRSYEGNEYRYYVGPPVLDAVSRIERKSP